MVNKKAQLVTIISLVVLLVLGFLVFNYVYKKSDSSPPDLNSVIAKTGGDDTLILPDKDGNTKTYTVEITSAGFSPKELTINKGDSVIWINKDSKERWPASASHPTHTVYPGVDYNRPGSYAGSEACISEGVAKDSAFDPCKGLAKEESWTFTFNQVGSWNYHDHLVSGNYGKIIVQ